MPVLCAGLHIFDDEVNTNPVTFGSINWHHIVASNPIFPCARITEESTSRGIALVRRYSVGIISSTAGDVSVGCRKCNPPLFADMFVDSSRRRVVVSILQLCSS